MQVNLDTRDPYHIVFRGQKGSLVNMDLTTNNILVGPDQGALFTGNPACFVLGPLNSGYADGTKDLWAIALTGAPQVAFMEGLQNWQPSPAQIQEQLNALGLATETTQLLVKANTGATKTSVDGVNTTLGVPAQTADIGNLHNPGQTVANEISTTGVPLLTKSVLLHHSNATGIAAGGSTQAGSPYTPITQIGYEISLGLSIPAAATAPGAQVTLVWSDSVTGDTVAQEQWILAAGSAAVQQYIGTGPTKGDTLTLTILNLDAAQTLTYTLTIAQNSRVYVRDDWRQTTAVNIPGSTAGNYRMAGNIVLETAPALGVSQSAIRWIGLFAGEVTFMLLSGVNGICSFQIFTFLDPTTALNNAPLYQSPVIAANGSLQATVSLPRQSCALVINNGPNAQTPSAFAVISEQLA